MKKTLLALFLGSMLFTGYSNAASSDTQMSAGATHNSAPGSATITPITPDINKLLQVMGKNISGFGTGPQQKEKMPLIIFFDPQCPYCKNLWSSASAPENKSLSIVWIPIGLVNNYSMNQAAALIQSSDAEKTMNTHEADISTGGHGIDVDPNTLDKTALEKAQRNTLLFSKMNFKSVPIILHVTSDGKLLIKEGDVDVQGLKDIYNY